MIKFFKKIEIKKPVIICAWPGMGNVALGAVSYMRKKLKAAKFAEIKTRSLYMPNAVLVENGVSVLPEVREDLFYFSKNHNLVFFESATQAMGEEGLRAIADILDMAKSLNADKIFTGAAFPVPVGYEESPEVYGVVNQERMREMLVKFGVKIMEEGQIAGMNGLLLGYTGKKEIKGICLLATIPLYAVGFSNPKASKAILEVLEKMLGVEIDMAEMELDAREMEKKMKMIEENIKEIFPAIEKKTGTKIDVDKSRVPNYVMKRIDKLFKEARADRKKAHELKQELDRWNLYDMYEDRFLDLFKDRQ